MDRRRLAQRLQVARDLHDFVAHDISGIVTQAQAARFVAAGRPEAAGVALARIEAAGLAALDEQWSVPVENLLSPDLVRRLMWSPPAEVTPEAVAAFLADGGARPWQVDLTRDLLAAAATEA